MHLQKTLTLKQYCCIRRVEGQHNKLQCSIYLMILRSHLQKSGSRYRRFLNGLIYARITMRLGKARVLHVIDKVSRVIV